jgi:hypothetical protein
VRPDEEEAHFIIVELLIVGYLLKELTIGYLMEELIAFRLICTIMLIIWASLFKSH